jgi:hypothetical protein
VVIDVSEEEARLGLVDDDADTGIGADRPEMRVARGLDAVEAQARSDGIDLQVDGRGLGGLLRLPIQPGERRGRSRRCGIP